MRVSQLRGILAWGIAPRAHRIASTLLEPLTGGRWMVNLLVAAALAAASPAIAPAAPQASADPAMFVVGDADTTVYIFGTFHALDGQSNWFDSKIRNAFEQ